MSHNFDPTDPGATEPLTQVLMIASVVYEEWPDGSRTARLSFWEQPPHVYCANGEWLNSREEPHPAIDAARQRMLEAFPEQEQPLPTLVMREVRA
jgi:hypothetical protein